MGAPDLPVSALHVVGLKFGNIKSINTANWEDYSTCRGRPNRIVACDTLAKLCRTSDNALVNDAKLYDEMNSILWDLFCHQGTLYSATPLALMVIIQNVRLFGSIANKEIRDFIYICKDSGTAGLYLSKDEVSRNKADILPMYRIEDVLFSFGDA